MFVCEVGKNVALGTDENLKILIYHKCALEQVQIAVEQFERSDTKHFYILQGSLARLYFSIKFVISPLQPEGVSLACGNSEFKPSPFLRYLFLLRFFFH